ncbi:hypothetical protein OAV61_07710 [Flavobacteriaceae bacterium]|nr:hypothetical protein [Flavobacteriaceae bacterium]
MKKLLLFLVTISCLSCSSSDDNPCDNLASNGEEVSLNLINTALVFFADNSNPNCVAYETAAEEYIDYSNSILNCLNAIDRAELEEEIEDLEAEIAALNCT